MRRVELPRPALQPLGPAPLGDPREPLPARPPGPERDRADDQETHARNKSVWRRCRAQSLQETRGRPEPSASPRRRRVDLAHSPPWAGMRGAGRVGVAARPSATSRPRSGTGPGPPPTGTESGPMPPRQGSAPSGAPRVGVGRGIRPTRSRRSARNRRRPASRGDRSRRSAGRRARRRPGGRAGGRRIAPAGRPGGATGCAVARIYPHHRSDIGVPDTLRCESPLKGCPCGQTT